MTSPFLSYKIEGRLFLGLASSTMLGRSSESFTTYQATPALTAPAASKNINRIVVINILTIEKLFFFFFFSAGLGCLISGVLLRVKFACCLLARGVGDGPNKTSSGSILILLLLLFRSFI